MLLPKLRLDSTIPHISTCEGSILFQLPLDMLHWFWDIVHCIFLSWLWYLFDMDPLCISFMAMIIAFYICIFHGSVVYLMGFHACNHTWEWVCPPRGLKIATCLYVWLFFLDWILTTFTLTHCPLKIYNVFWPSVTFLTSHIRGHLLYHQFPPLKHWKPYWSSPYPTYRPLLPIPSWDILKKHYFGIYKCPIGYIACVYTEYPRDSCIHVNKFLKHICMINWRMICRFG